MATANLPRSQLQDLSAAKQAAVPSTPKPKTATSNATAESVIRDLELNAALCLERLQLLLDSVSDAVIQTQDVSAQVQTWVGGTVEGISASSILFDAMLLVATDGLAVVADRVLAGVVKNTLTRLFNHNEALAAVTTSAIGSTLKGGTGLSVNLSGWEEIGDQFGIFSRGVQKAGEEGFGSIGKALAQSAKGKDEAKSPLGDGTDMPRTAITRGVQSYVAAHRLALRASVIGLTYAIRSGQIGVSDGTRLVQSLAMTSSGESLEDLRDALARGFELLIWERIYDPALQKAKFTAPDPSSNAAKPAPSEVLPSVEAARAFLAANPNVCMKGIPGALVDYWRARYRAAIDGVKNSDGSTRQPTSNLLFQASPKVSNAYNDVRILYGILQDAERALANRLGNNAGAIGSLMATKVPQAG